MSYRNYLKLLEKWPINHHKGDLDFGKYLRTYVEKEFPNKDSSPPVTSQRILRERLESLNRIADNYHFKKYKRQFPNSTVTEGDKETLQEAARQESIENISNISFKRFVIDSYLLKVKKITDFLGKYLKKNPPSVK